MNDFIRDKLSMPDGKIPLWAEIVAGGTVRSCDEFAFTLDRVSLAARYLGYTRALYSCTARSMGSSEEDHC